MSYFDTLLNIDQVIKLKGLQKYSETQLKISLANNVELKKLREQITSDNKQLNNSLLEQNKLHQEQLLLQQKQLEQQIQIIENSELQKFHKERVFKCKEFIAEYYNLQNDTVKSYFISNYLKSIETLINDSKARLESLSDKEYCFNLLQDCRNIKESFTPAYDTTPFKELDYLISSKNELLKNGRKITADIKNKNRQIDNLNAETLKINEEFENKNKKDKSSLKVGIAFFSIVGLFSVIMIWGIIEHLIDGSKSYKSKMVWIGLPIFSLLTFLWIKSLTQYKKAKKLPDKIFEDKNIEAIENLKKEIADLEKSIKENGMAFEKLHNLHKEKFEALITKYSEFKKVKYLIENYEIEN